MSFQELPLQENYWQGYQDEINKLKNDPRIVEFDKLCFHVFGLSDDGQKLLSYLRERMIFPSTPGNLDANHSTRCIYYEGYREAFRQLIIATENYRLRKEAEDAKAVAAKGDK